MNNTLCTMTGSSRLRIGGSTLLLMLFGFDQGISTQATATSTEAALVAEARTALHVHDLDRAEIKAHLALVANPRSADAMYVMGQLSENRKRPKESLDWFTRAAAISPPSAEDLRLVGLDYVLLDDYPDALHWLTRSVEMAADNAEAWYDLARAQMMLGNFTEAEAPLRHALALQPRMAKAKNNLGVVYEAQNRTLDAAAAYREAIAWGEADAHPSEQPLLNLGTLLMTGQHIAEAVTLLQRAVALAPDDVKCNEQLARALDQQGDHAQAIARMQHAIALAPKEARLHFELGQIYKRAGQIEEGKKELTLSGELYGSHSSESAQ